MTLEKLKYPIGRYQKPIEITAGILKKNIQDVEDFPRKIRKEFEEFSDEQLDNQYRSWGWTIRQLVIHCADSHMNSLIRFKLALTENKPIIKPYFEDRWADLPDSKNILIEPALKLIEGLHERWVVLLKSLTEEQLAKTFIHPEHNKEFSLEETITIYAWHCNHHLAHIKELKRIKNWE